MSNILSFAGLYHASPFEHLEHKDVRLPGTPNPQLEQRPKGCDSSARTGRNIDDDDDDDKKTLPATALAAAISPRRTIPL